VHIMNTHELISVTRASIAADSSVPSRDEPVISHCLDAGCSSSGPEEPQQRGLCRGGSLVEVREADFIDDDAFERFDSCRTLVISTEEC